MNYKIVKDPDELARFIAWLPDLEKKETYYVTLMVRAKYCPTAQGINSDKVSLKRFTSNKERLFAKLKQLECEEGMYFQGKTPVPQEGLAVYITPNPRDMEKATKNSLIKFATLITQEYYGYNPYQEVMSEIQKTVGTKVYVDFDFDVPLGTDKEVFIESIKTQVLEKVNAESVTFLKTKGGLHVLINTSKIDPSLTKTWYRAISYMKEVDQISSTSLIPIPGCTQGNYVPHFIT